MSTDPAPSVTRGDVTLQPSYFTSSLFVEPLREDIARLIQAYAQQYLGILTNGATQGTGSAEEINRGAAQHEASQGGVDPTTNGHVVENTVGIAENSNPTPALAPSTGDTEPLSSVIPPQQSSESSHIQPFMLFKQLWSSQGWSWFHLKVLDGRARESFVSVVLRLFAEYFGEEVNPLAQAIALFGMYTFYTTQPASGTLSNPVPGPTIYRVKHIALPYDTYDCLLSLPAQLTGPQLSPLSPYVTYLLSTLLQQDAFHIYPHSSLKTQYALPREWLIDDTEVPEADAFDGLQRQGPKKKGRPGRADRGKKHKEALSNLNRWLERSTYTYPDAPAAGEASTSIATGAAGNSTPKRTTHTLVSHPPKASLAIYQIQKQEYLNAVDPGNLGVSTSETLQSQEHLDGASDRLREKEAIKRANEAVLTRLKKIDEMAAEQGLEVGGEGGEMTGLERVEKAVKEMRSGTGSGRRAGILNLVEGAGMDPSAETANDGRNDPLDATMDVG
ncbi:hypothetical protein BC629DRAFT_1469026 [Irpex lacteus]|nr:hypothetical protein BC629DRAFT_1469026 [Irpex lacteus]